MNTKFFLPLLCVGMLLTSCKGDKTEYDASGVFEVTEVVVSAEAQGQITDLSFNEGDKVTAGQQLGTIDAVQLTLQKDQLVANQQVNTTRKLNVPSQVESLNKSITTQQQQIATQRQQVEVQRQQVEVQRQQAEAQRQQLANLRKERQRFASLLADNAGTEKQVADIDYQISVLEKQIAAADKQIAAGEAQITAAEKQISVSEAQIGVTQSQISEKSEQLTVNNNTLDSQNAAIGTQIGSVDAKLDDAIVRAPIAGVILQKYAEVGEYAIPGKALFKVGNINDMKLRAYVTASQLTGLKIGQKVTVYADKGDSERKAYQGTITWISQKAEFTPKTIQTRDERANLVYAIKISVKNDGIIKAGMYGDVKL